MANWIDPAYERFLELKSEIQAALKAKPNESENKALSGIAKLKKRGRSTLMVTSLDRSGRWETQAQIDACLAETGVTKDQVVRWRRKGLLPKEVEQDSAYHGSVVRFPIGTCAQIKAAKALFEEKNRVSYVGLRLWRQGFPVSDKHWRPRLKRLGRLADRMLLILQWLQTRYDRDDQGGTLSERAAQRPISNIILSRIFGRVKADDLAIVWRVLTDIGTGQFEGFEPPVTGETQTRDERATITALDIGASERHKILGQGLNLLEVLPSALNFAAIAFSMGSFEQAADEPEEEIAQARNDAQNALTIGLSLYEAAKGIYGDQAFGLRFFAWFAKKAPDALIDGLILPMMRLRAIPGAILSSEKIAKLAIQARAAREMYARIEQLGRETPGSERFSTQNGSGRHTPTKLA